MRATIHDSGPLVDDLALARLQADLGVSLPLEYQAFLRAHNGGYPDPNVFERDSKRPGGRAKGLVSEFFTVEQLPDFREIYAGRIPPNLLAVGNDPGGNLLLLSVSGDDVGRVYFWAHEYEHEPPTYKNVHRIADDFSSFLESIHESAE